MRLCCRLILLSLGASLAFAQLTMDQKVSDFQALSAVYAKRYGPYEWKVKSMGYDLMNIGPWLTKVQATKDDLDFYEVASEYVASLNDAHDYYLLPSTFYTYLNFLVDIYDGKLLVDYIDRSRLPAAEYPFLIGYELVSIDGQDAQKRLDGLERYQIAANRRSTRRLAAELLTYRPQNLMPHAADVPEISTVVFRRPDGKLESYRIPWAKSGLLLTSVGRYPTPKAAIADSAGEMRDHHRAGGPSRGEQPAWKQLLQRLGNCRLPDRAVNGFGSLSPIFAASLPADFEQRLGKSSRDPFFSGSFTASGYKIGFIRIPSYSPSDATAAVTAFQKEIAWFEANTDGLVVDEMRNPGGQVAYLNTLVSYLMPYPWDAIGFELRATSEWVVAISSTITSAKAQGAPQEIIDLLQMLMDEIQGANREMRGRTQPIPLDDVTLGRFPAMDSKGKVIAYTKPLIVLIDELSASGGDLFPATVQDNGRGLLVGWRTMGAGGSVEPWEAGTYSLGTTTVTESLMHRKNDIVTSDYPAAPYIENIGVRPDIQVDYMTRDNLMQNGRPFVDGFVTAIVAQIQNGK